jgi:hypothetical protein
VSETRTDKLGNAIAIRQGVFPLYAAGQRVRFADGRVGVLNADRRDDATKIPTFDQLYIDLGAPDKKSGPVNGRKRRPRWERAPWPTAFSPT